MNDPIRNKLWADVYAQAHAKGGRHWMDSRDDADRAVQMYDRRPVPAARLGDGARYLCRKCGEQNEIEFNSARIVTHNPHTGQRRDERDIASDPEGKLIVVPGEPIYAGRPE